MTNETNSIFDKDFLQEAAVRRRDLMPLALKIYVWCFLGVSIFTIGRGAYSEFTTYAVGDISSLSPMDVFNLIFTLLMPLIRFLPNLFLLMEKKWAVLTALIGTGISMLLWCYNTFTIYSLTGSTMFIVINTFWLLIEVPYVVMLFKIKNAWETTAVAKAP